MTSLLRTIDVTVWNERTVVTLTENEKIIALTICDDEKDALGSIYKGVVTEVKTNIGAYFVQIGQDEITFLKMDESLHANIQIGDTVIVQTVNEKSRYKRCQVTMKLTFVGHYVIYSPFTNYIAFSKKLSEKEREQWLPLANAMKVEREGFIFRTAVAKASKDEVEKEIRFFRKQLEQIIEKSVRTQAPALLYRGKDCIEQTLDRYQSLEISYIRTDRKTYYEQLKTTCKEGIQYIKKLPIDVEKEIHHALKKVVWMSDGSYLLFEENESLIVIDVNSGHSKRNPIEINRNAAHEAMRQLRIRNLSGMIVIDFLRMTKDEQTILQQEIEKAITLDVNKVMLFGFTRMGLFELTRKKIGRSLKEWVNEKK